MPNESFELIVPFSEKPSLNCRTFENIYTQNGKRLLARQTKEVIFQVPKGLFFVVDGTLQFLTLCNYLILKRKKVKIIFSATPQEEKSNLSYLRRIGFFDALSPRVIVEPKCDLKMPENVRGHSANLMEIQKIGFTKVEKLERKKIPGIISKCLEAAYSGRDDRQKIANTCSTLMAELTENIELHSESKFEGYAALQTFPANKTLKIGVSDCGLGILKTVRPKLKKKFKRYKKSKLILEMVNRGRISRTARGGAGLRSCALNALKFKAQVWIRLPECSVTLKPAEGEGQYNMMYYRDKVPFFPGTHISFEYQLTSPSVSG